MKAAAVALMARQSPKLNKELTKFIVDSIKLYLDGTTKQALEKSWNQAVNKVIKNSTKAILPTETVKGLTKIHGKTVVKVTGKEVVEEISEQAASRLAQAKVCVRSTVLVGAVVEGVFLGCSVARKSYDYSRGRITRSELRQHTIKRSSAAVGSVGLCAAGSFIGTLVFPGVGTFVGGVIGGVVGEMGGAKVGQGIDHLVAQH